MDTTKFELTEREATEAWHKGYSEAAVIREPVMPSAMRAIAKAQVSKVLSMLEPVELEALDEEALDTLSIGGGDAWEYVRDVIQATIQYNQSKGQLFRLKEE